MRFLKEIPARTRPAGEVKVMIAGMAQHGKDELCKYLMELLPTVRYISSSVLFYDLFMFDTLKEQFGYKTKEEAYARRNEVRPLLYRIVRLFNYHDKAAFSREVFSRYNIYCGNRDDEEMDAAYAAGLFDFTVVVNASGRKPEESPASYGLSPRQYHIEIDNNGNKEDLRREAVRLAEFIKTYYEL